MNNEKGSILIVLLIILFSLAGIGLAFFLTSNANLLVAINEIKGEKLYLGAETGARLAIAKYRETTPNIDIVSWDIVYDTPTPSLLSVSGTIDYPNGVISYKGYTEENLATSTVTFWGIGKGFKNAFRVVKANAHILAVTSPTPTPTSTPAPVVNTGNRIASQSLENSVSNPETNVIEVVETGKVDREEGGVIEINKTGPGGTLTIKGAYRPTNGESGGKIAHYPWEAFWGKKGVPVSEARPVVRKTIVINASNVTIEGLWIEPPSDAPLISEYDGSLSDSENETGCYVVKRTDSFVTDHTDISCNNVPFPYKKLPVPHHEKAAIIIKGNNVTIRNNLIVRKDGSYDVGIYVAPNVTGLKIEHNTFVNVLNINDENLWDAIWNDFYGTNCKSYHMYDYNVSSDENGNSAIVLNDIDHSINAEITNNIFGICRLENFPIPGFFNNEFKYTIGVEVLGERDNTHDENIICSNNDFYDNLVALGNLNGSNNLAKNPKFVSWKGGVFTLKQGHNGSELIGAGTDGKDLGIDYNSSIFRNLTIVNYEHPEDFESLREAVKYAINGEEIKVEKNLTTSSLEYNSPILEIPQNDINIYSEVGPKMDTKIPYILDITGKGININGLKFELASWAKNFYNEKDWSEYGIGVVNIGMKYLFQNSLTGWDKPYASINNSIIIRPFDSKIAGISGGYMDEVDLSHVIVTSPPGKKAMGDGIRFIDKSGTVNPFFSSSGRGKFNIVNSIITGYITDGTNDNHKIAGVSTSCLDGECDNCKNYAGSCSCGLYTVCDDGCSSIFSGSRKIEISQSDIWGNECDIKYRSNGEVNYTDIISVNPGFNANTGEDEQFYIGPPLTDCGCNFDLGIKWDDFTE